MPTIAIRSTFALLGLTALLAAGAVRAEADGGAPTKDGAQASEPAAEQRPEAQAPAAEEPGPAAETKTGEANKRPVEANAAGTAERAGEVARATFAEAIEAREPVGKVARVPPAAETVYYFTELRDLSGHTVTHRWLYQGEVKGEVAFDVGGPRWRVYSSKDFLPDWTGEWTVEVVTGDDRVLHRDSIVYGAR